MICVLAALAVIGWGVSVTGFWGDTGATSGSVLTYTVKGHHATVGYQVLKDSAATVHCKVQVLDTDHAVIGHRTVTARPGESDAKGTVEVAASGVPVSVQVTNCSTDH